MTSSRASSMNAAAAAASGAKQGGSSSMAMAASFDLPDDLDDVFNSMSFGEEGGEELEGEEER